MTTRNRISEIAEREFIRIYGDEDIKPRLERRLTALHVDQAANALLGLKMQSEVQLGIVHVPTCMIARYTGIEATQTAPFTANLPAFPIQLPMDMGVWSIKSSAGLAYIPIQTGFWDLMGGMDEGLLENQIGFYVRGRQVQFTKQPTATVDMELLIVDPALLGPHDPYPIPADLEWKLVEMVVERLKSNPLGPEKPKN